MSVYEKFLGHSFGSLIVLDEAGRNNRGERLWKCLCSCGNTTIVKSWNLSIGKTKSCGCLKTGPVPEDLSGQRFNNITVLSYSHIGSCRNRYFNCRCDCGKTKIIAGTLLKHNKTKSCGCLLYANRKRGKESHAWKAEISDEEREIGRNFPAYRDWCFEVKKRDNFTCQICGDNKGGNLVSHHLFNYADYPKWRIKIWNGICLCKDCHKGFHLAYGKRNTTRQKFKKYLMEIKGNE